MASKRIGIVISEELYERLKSFSDSESETITQTITIAIKNRINTQPIPGTIEHLSIPMPQLLDSAQGPTYSKKIAEEYPVVQKEEIIKKEEPKEILRTFENKILDLWNDQQIFCVYQHQEYQEIKDFLKTIPTNEPLVKIYQEAKRLTDIGFHEQKECTIYDFVDWAKKLIEPPQEVNLGITSKDI